MAINYPTSLDSLTNPSVGDPTTNPSHAAQHSNANDAIEALQAKVGVNGSAVTTSLDYQRGLIYITSAVVLNSTGATINNCFSSLYDNYRIIISNLSATSTNTSISMRLTTAGAYSAVNYSYAGAYRLFVGGGGDNTGSAQGAWNIATISPTAKSGVSIDIFNPYDGIYTVVNYISTNYDAGMSLGGVHQVNSSYDGFYLSGSAFSANVRVYGYKD